MFDFNANLKEIKINLGVMSIRKIFNFFKIWLSYIIAKTLKKHIHWGNPISIGIEPTTSCNLRCPECPSGLRAFTRPIGMLQKSTFEKLIDETHKDLVYLILYFQGEPYLNPEFLSMVKYATSKRILVSTSTNAHFLNDETAKLTVESGLQRIIISIDGTTQEVYQSYRVGGKLEKVIEGTKKLIEWKKKLNSSTPYIIFQFLVVRHNEHQIEDVQKLGKELGVDRVVLKTAQIYDYENGSDLIPTNTKYSRYYKDINNKWKIKNKLTNQCWKLWQGAEITWDGRVLPCCFDKDAQYEMGKFPESTFNQIWNNNVYKKFREKLLISRKNIDICSNCTEGTKVWAKY